MFDWNDEELENILWGEPGATDDHIVPYAEQNKDYHKSKEWNREVSQIKPSEKRLLGPNVDFNDPKTGTCAAINEQRGSNALGFNTEPWSGVCAVDAVNNDQQIMGAVSNKLEEDTQTDSLKGTDGQSKDFESFENPNESDVHDFVDYGWATIGSFEDLDRIFSNDESLFGSVSLDGVDELWLSNKNATISSMKSVSESVDSPYLESEALISASELPEIKAAYVRQDDQSLNCAYGIRDDHASSQLKHSTVPKRLENAGSVSFSRLKDPTNMGTIVRAAASKPNSIVDNNSASTQFAEKSYLKKKMRSSRGRSKEEGDQVRLLEDFYGACYPAGDATGTIEQPSAPCILPCAQPVGNPVNPYPTMPLLSTPLSGERNHQSQISGCAELHKNANHGNHIAKISKKNAGMTPREKIEKLRRRQQMQAMIAIQKQQHQLTQHVSCHSVAQKCPQENQLQPLEGPCGKVTDTGPVVSLDQSLPVEQNYSNTTSMAIDDSSMEDTILKRLQDVIAQLDPKIRLCIQDGLFRLAQSVMQRHHISEMGSTDTMSTEEHAFTIKEVNASDRPVKIGDVETETNPIDRAVAHLLFHRTSESVSMLLGMPESATSIKLSLKGKVIDSGNLPESPRSKQISSCQGPETPTSAPAEPHYCDRFGGSPCVDNTENPSSYGCISGGAMEVEAS